MDFLTFLLQKGGLGLLCSKHHWAIGDLGTCCSEKGFAKHSGPMPHGGQACFGSSAEWVYIYIYIIWE